MNDINCIKNSKYTGENGLVSSKRDEIENFKLFDTFFNDKRELSCCFTGHRVIKDDVENVASALRFAVSSLIQKNVTVFYCGGALGFDTLAATVVIEQRELLKGSSEQGLEEGLTVNGASFSYDKAARPIKLKLALPCENHFARWSKAQISRFLYTFNEADEVFYVSREYNKGCMQQRNVFMVDNSDMCVAYLREDRGGTFNAIKYADKVGKPVLRL